METDFSDYIIYVDESGDHSLEHINPEYPVFVLAFCIFNKKDYTNNITPALQSFKFKHFGHDMVVLHEHDIRKAEADFSILINADKRHDFMHGLSQLVDEAPFTIISTIIEKKKLKEKYDDPANPYHLALGFGLERVYSLLRDRHQAEKKTHIIFECRGKREDNDLELEFRRICAGKNRWGVLPFEAIFANKKTNSCGLQLADLIARPIGRYVLDSTQTNRAYTLIEKKFYRSKAGKMNGRGLKCFP